LPAGHAPAADSSPMENTASTCRQLCLGTHRPGRRPATGRVNLKWACGCPPSRMLPQNAVQALCHFVCCSRSFSTNTALWTAARNAVGLRARLRNTAAQSRQLWPALATGGWLQIHVRTHDAPITGTSPGGGHAATCTRRANTAAG
jgi:hypothetical protein